MIVKCASSFLQSTSKCPSLLYSSSCPLALARSRCRVLSKYDERKRTSSTKTKWHTQLMVHSMGSFRSCRPISGLHLPRVYLSKRVCGAREMERSGMQTVGGDDRRPGNSRKEQGLRARLVEYNISICSYPSLENAAAPPATKAALQQRVLQAGQQSYAGSGAANVEASDAANGGASCAVRRASGKAKKSRFFGTGKPFLHRTLQSALLCFAGCG